MVEDAAEAVEVAPSRRGTRTTPIPECIKPERMHRPSRSRKVEPEPEPEPEPAPAKKAKAGFSAKLFESLASVGGFYGGSAQVEPVIPVVPFEEDQAAEAYGADEPIEPPVGEDERVEAAVAEDEPVEPPVADDEPEAPIAEDEPEAPPVVTEEPVAPEQIEQFVDGSVEGPMHSKSADVQAKADEARQAKLRSKRRSMRGSARLTISRSMPRKTPRTI